MQPVNWNEVIGGEEMETKEALKFIESSIKDAVQSIQEKGIDLSEIHSGPKVFCDGKKLIVGIECEVYFDGALFKVCVGM